MLDRDRGSYNGGEGREKMERWGKEIGRKTRGGRGKKAGVVAEAIRWQTKLAKRPGTGCFQLHYRTVINWCPRCSIVSEGRLGSGSRGVSFFAARQNHTVRALSLSLSPFLRLFLRHLAGPRPATCVPEVGFFSHFVLAMRCQSIQQWMAECVGGGMFWFMEFRFSNSLPMRIRSLFYLMNWIFFLYCVLVTRFNFYPSKWKIVTRN